VDGEHDAAALAGVDPRDIGQQQVADGVLTAFQRPHANEVRHGHGQLLGRWLRDPGAGR
jgi:hypothetical protein